jgi:hypothetical protein
MTRQKPNQNPQHLWIPIFLDHFKGQVKVTSFPMTLTREKVIDPKQSSLTLRASSPFFLQLDPTDTVVQLTNSSFQIYFIIQFSVGNYSTSPWLRRLIASPLFRQIERGRLSISAASRGVCQQVAYNRIIYTNEHDIPYSIHPKAGYRAFKWLACWTQFVSGFRMAKTRWPT